MQETTIDTNHKTDITATIKKRLSPDEKIQKINARIEQLKQQKQALENREKQTQRKKRTRRLIEYGALAEKYFDCVDIEPKEFEELLSKIVYTEAVRGLLSTKK